MSLKKYILFSRPELYRKGWMKPWTAPPGPPRSCRRAPRACRGCPARPLPAMRSALSTTRWRPPRMAAPPGPASRCLPPARISSPPCRARPPAPATSWATRSRELRRPCARHQRRRLPLGAQGPARQHLRGAGGGGLPLGQHELCRRGRGRVGPGGGHQQRRRHVDRHERVRPYPRSELKVPVSQPAGPHARSDNAVPPRRTPLSVRNGPNARGASLERRTAVRVRSHVAVHHHGASTPPSSCGRWAEPFRQPSVTGRHLRRRRRRYRWRAGPGCRGPGHSASWSAGRRAKPLPGRRAAGHRRPARR
jgi:hypothetical protein